MGRGGGVKPNMCVTLGGFELGERRKPADVVKEGCQGDSPPLIHLKKKRGGGLRKGGTKDRILN